MSIHNEHAVLNSSCGQFSSFWWSGADMAPGHLKLLDWHICTAFWCAFIRDFTIFVCLICEALMKADILHYVDETLTLYKCFCDKLCAEGAATNDRMQSHAIYWTQIHLWKFTYIILTSDWRLAMCQFLVRIVIISLFILICDWLKTFC